MRILQLLSIGVFQSKILVWSILSNSSSGLDARVACRTGAPELSTMHLYLTLQVAFQEIDLLKQKPKNDCTHLGNK